MKYEITPAGEVKLSLPNHTIFLSPSKAENLYEVLSVALAEQRNHEDEMEALRFQALPPAEAVDWFNSAGRKTLRRLGRGQTIWSGSRLTFIELKILNRDGSVTPRGHRLIKALAERDERHRLKS